MQYETSGLSRNGAAPLPLTPMAKGSSTSAGINPDGKFLRFLPDGREKPVVHYPGDGR
ncbi:hypothetical protein [Rufibacter latericius]|uniref:hypothetical protein n=1 Tax=Rufibacter latericius TaxID=2487040 RepID=UPI001402C037|nr:hypothetical protein [Rufibacter latericius]